MQVLGCGDAFGSGGRFNTCFPVSASTTSSLIDCGASALVAVRRFGVEPNEIETVFLSYLHGDHCGGLPFLILDAQHVSRRSTPLTIAGPPGLRERLPALMEAMLSGSSPVRHPSGAPSYALRLECENKVSATRAISNGSRLSYPPGVGPIF